MSGLKLLLFLHTLEPFGSQRTALGIARHLPKRDYTVTVCSWWGDETLRPDFEKAGATVVPLGATAVSDLGAFHRFHRLVREKSIDLIHAHVPEMAVFACLSGKLRRIFKKDARVPIVCFTLNNALESEPPAQKRWHKWAVRLSDHTVCAARHILNSFEKFFSSDVLKRASVIYNAAGLEQSGGGKDAARMSAFRREVQCAPDDVLLTCAARFTEQKGHKTLFQALKILQNQGRRVKLILAGDGELEKPLRTFAGSLGLGQSIAWLGRRNDVQNVLEGSDIFVMASQWEGLAVSVLEAMAAGLPVVATKIEGIQEATGDGEAAILVPVNDPPALAEAVDRLIRDPLYARSLGEKGRARVRDCFSEKAMSERYQELYENLSKSPGPA